MNSRREASTGVLGEGAGDPIAFAGGALVVAAHGSVEPAVNDGIVGLARRVGERLGFDEAIAAFHQGDPAFSIALDRLRSEDVIVVPLLQSEGYYCHRVLPTELARNRRFPSLRVRQTRAVGVHPHLAEALARRVRELARCEGLQHLEIALVAHGTPRHHGSRQAADASARDVERRTGFSARPFFLDEEPRVESIVDLASGSDVLVVPLLIGAGRHASRDLAQRLGFGAGTDASSGGAGENGVWRRRAGDRVLLVDRPFGLDPAIEEIVADLARSAVAAAEHALT